MGLAGRIDGCRYRLARAGAQSTIVVRRNRDAAGFGTLPCLANCDPVRRAEPTHAVFPSGTLLDPPLWRTALGAAVAGDVVRRCFHPSAVFFSTPGDNQSRSSVRLRPDDGELPTYLVFAECSRIQRDAFLDAADQHFLHPMRQSREYSGLGNVWHYGRPGDLYPSDDGVRRCWARAPLSLLARLSSAIWPPLLPELLPALVRCCPLRRRIVDALCSGDSAHPGSHRRRSA